MTIDERNLDKIKELINIGIGRSSSVLNQLVKSRIILSVPHISVIPYQDFKNHNFGYKTQNLSTVSMKFSGDMKGSAEIIFPIDSASQIVTLLSNKDYPKEEMDKMRSNSLTEVGNIVLNSLIGTMSNLLKIRFSYKIPTYSEITDEKFHELQHEAMLNVILAETNFKVQDSKIEGSFLLFFEVDSFDSFIKRLEVFNG